MFPNKNGFWYLFGLILAGMLNFMIIIGDFIGFFVFSIVITYIFHNSKKKTFKGNEIWEIGLTCAVTLFIISLLFSMMFVPDFHSSVILVFIITMVLRILAVSGGIWVYNRAKKIK